MLRRYRRRSRSDAWAILGVLVLASLYHKGYLRDFDQLLFLAVKVGAVVCTLVAIVWLLRRRQAKKSSGKMDGLAFERHVASLLPGLGFTNIRLTERYDLGIDIIAVKGGVTWGIQVKYYRGLVKASAVRQVVTALNYYGCQRAMVVTNSKFSRPAEKLALSNDCALVDGKELARW